MTWQYKKRCWQHKKSIEVDGDYKGFSFHPYLLKKYMTLRKSVSTPKRNEDIKLNEDLKLTSTKKTGYSVVSEVFVHGDELHIC